MAADMSLHGTPNDLFQNFDPIALIILIPVCTDSLNFLLPLPPCVKYSRCIWMLGSSLLSPLSDYGYLRIPRFTSNGIRRASRFPYLAWLHVRCSSHGLFRCSSGELRALNLTTTLNIFILMMMMILFSPLLSFSEFYLQNQPLRGLRLRVRWCQW